MHPKRSEAMSRGAKIALWILLIAVLALVFYRQGRKRLRKDEALSIEAVQSERGIPVDVVRAPVLPLQDWRRFTGEVEGWKQVDLTSDFRTRVDAVHVKLGEEVSAGELIVSLDPSDPARAMLNRDAAAARYGNAKADSARAETLFARGALSLQQLEQQRALATAARVAFESASKAVDLRSPIAGVITSLGAEADRYAESGAVLATIASLDSLRLRIALSQGERALVRVGQAARIAVDGGGTLEGQVHEVALSADSETRLFDAEIAIVNRNRRLHPGALVSVEILVGESRDHPLLPATSLFRLGDRRFCYLVGDGDSPRAVRREVGTGIESGGLVAVSSGLDENQRVVIAGMSKLEEGSKVIVRNDLSEHYFSGLR